MKKHLFIVIVVLGLALAACGAPSAPAGGGGLKVVASTSLVGDVVRVVGGEKIELLILMPPGVDPHSYQPAPQDVAALAEADLIFLNGLELEHALEAVIESSGTQATRVEVSESIPPRMPSQAEETFIEAIHGQGGEESGDSHEAGDPHVWTNPNNVALWVTSIQEALSQADPENATFYAGNAGAYLQELQALDAWVREQVAQVPAENRRLLSNHLTWGYFADAYGFEQVGAIIPSFSAMAEPSAQELAALEDAVQTSGVKAIFVENTLSPRLAERVAADTGIALVALLTDSLDAEKAPTYLEYVRYNVAAIVEALK